MAEATVLICTRDRPTELVRAVRSLLASDGVEFELIVLDQSDGDLTELALQEITDGRLSYVRSSTMGKGAGMNEAIALADTSIVLFTDDDCEAPPDWVRGMVAMLKGFPQAAVAFSSVVAAPHDARLGYIPAFVFPRTAVIRTVRATTFQGRGLGAGMACRREALRQIGGVDELLGPGARFGGCEDWDIELRAILAGWHSVHSGDIHIVHHGFRRNEDGASHARRDWTGIGATLGKLVQAGKPSIALLAAWEFFMHAVLPPAKDVLHLRRPMGLTRITAFARGFRDGFLTEVDRSSSRFAR
jgi:GT2 family glycosyltransferase